ncbi:MAG: hypothetical protein IKP64_03125 [Selenomonadaceae bacterium]|nr:hypothetical protein [Selenomonadaceae bacterium]MBR4382529.1 hypothetical protein [Selenomonadaceae bacterium]
MDLFNRSQTPEMSDRRKALLDKSDSAERKVLWKYFLLVALILAVLFCLADTVEEWFPNLDALSLILAIPLSIGTGVVCHIELAKRMKTIRHATEASSYLEKDSVDVSEQSDTFVIYKSYVRGSVEETSDDPNKGNF